MLKASKSPLLNKILLPLILFFVLVVPLYIGEYVPHNVKAFLYSISLSMKEVLIFLLPFIIFSFIFSTLLNLKSSVIKFIAMLIGLVFVSVVLPRLGFTVGSLFLPHLDFNPSCGRWP